MYEITTQERAYLLDSMKNLLVEYDYEYEEYALNQIIDEWACQKETLIKAFKNHPNYVEGKFLIAFNTDYERIMDTSAIIHFKTYLRNVIEELCLEVPSEIRERTIQEHCCYLPARLYDFLVYDLDKIICERTINEGVKEFLEEILPQIHPHTGEKSSRVINRICTYLGFNKHPDYNKEYAKFADSLSPMTIKRHTVLSLNPLDYLTMSFGNSWASCHTIDKQNKRGMPNSYEGMYSSGTISYMLDESSMVFYTVDSAYDGVEYWTQPKINRQMFHYGQDKLVQGRLYPQDNDGCCGAYAQYRQIVQAIMATIFDFPNLWSLHKGTDAASQYIYSHGTHYRDYEHFDNCTLSRIKNSSNEQCFDVGASPICIKCGCTHDIENNISCCSQRIVCKNCGEIIDNEDEAYWINGYPYCSDCVAYCDECGEIYLLDNLQRVHRNGGELYICDNCRDDSYLYCENCDEYHYDSECTWVDSVGGYICNECLDIYYAQCSHCGEYFLKRDMVTINGKQYCGECYKEMEVEEEK